MSTFAEAMHADAMAAQGYQHHYHPTQGYLHQDRVMDRADCDYMHEETMMDNNDYINLNGYYAPPQAPRLSAAAARASSMAAMYYNPTLHPLHPLSSHVGGLDPWAASYHAGDYGRHSIPAPAYHHQQIEHQLMAQNKRGLGNQAGYSTAASAYGLEQNQPDQYSHRYSYPHDRSQSTWNQVPSSAWAWKEQQQPSAVLTSTYQRHLSDATPTGHALNYGGNSYFDYAKQSSNPPADNLNPHSHSHSLSLPPPAHTQESTGRSRYATQRDGWNAAGVGWRYPYATHDQEGGWQGEMIDWSQMNASGTSWNGGAVKNMADEWISHNDHSTLPSSQIYDSQCNDYIEADVAVVSAPEQAAEKRGVVEEPQKESAVDKTTAAPPSPGTLDKSSVPISSVGAEMIWSASAVFLEPELLALCGKFGVDFQNGRSRCASTASLTSSGKYTPFLTESDWAPSPISLSSDKYHPHHHHSQRGTPTSRNLQRRTFGTGEAAGNSEESSASSSEPGTPPSSFPAYMYDEARRIDGKYSDKSKSFRKSQEMRGLGLAAPDLTFAINRQMKQPLPLLERNSSQDRMQEAVLSVLRLVSSECRWSIFDDKFLSLSQSLRDGASQGLSQSTANSNGANTKMHNSGRSISPRSEDSPSSNSAPVMGSESSPAFRRFAHQVLAQTLVSPTAFMLAIMYSLRVPHLAIHTNSEGVAVLDAEAKEIFAHPPSAAPFKLFTLGLMIANKHLDDNTFLNKTWNEVTGISLSEINRMERWFLEKSSYEISVPEDSWATFLERLAIRTDAKLITFSTMQHRVSSKFIATSSSTGASMKTLGGLTQEEALKRMLLSIEDALVALGRLAPFDLTQQNPNALPLRPMDRQSASPSIGKCGSVSQTSNPLQSLHHDCRSAPSLALYQNNTEDCDMDVFGDEIGPYRPHRDSIRSTLGKERHSVDPIFNRSISEDTASRTWRQQQQQQLPLDIHRKMSDRSAPLAPSVLLDLLNRGQHFAHTAH